MTISLCRFSQVTNSYVVKKLLKILCPVIYSRVMCPSKMSTDDEGAMLDKLEGEVILTSFVTTGIFIDSLYLLNRCHHNKEVGVLAEKPNQETSIHLIYTYHSCHFSPMCYYVVSTHLFALPRHSHKILSHRRCGVACLCCCLKCV